MECVEPLHWRRVHSQVPGKDAASKNNKLTPHIGLGFKSGDRVAKVVLKYVMVRPVIPKVILSWTAI